MALGSTQLMTKHSSFLLNSSLVRETHKITVKMFHTDYVAHVGKEI